MSILVFLVFHVTEPDPDLLFSRPAMYMMLIENAGGIILINFLQQVGLPTWYFQRSTRRMDGVAMDKLHAYAFHIFRAAGKNSSREISLLHLISIFGVHPELREYLRARAFVSETGRVGANITADRSGRIIYPS